MERNYVSLMVSFPLRFPNLDHTFPIIRKPTFSSIVQTSVSGREIRATQNVYPLWEFELTFDYLRDESQNISPYWQWRQKTELQEIAELYLNCRGKWGNFFFKDPFDNSRQQGSIGTGDGLTKTFIFPRYFGPSSSLTFPEPVGNIDYIDNLYLNFVPVLPDSYTISGNSVTFGAAPGSGNNISADFGFSYLCRFLDDDQEYEEFMHYLFTLKKCRFRSVKQPDVPSTALTTQGGVILTAG